jgi:glycosyltransferase involved in cell wall biosynthesis
MHYFSIITVCLNEAASIRATCQSICAQSFEDLEWIVIDGGSTDGTLEILREYEDSIDCLISEQDSGIYNAMNKGAAKASGHYLIFMNGGDRFACSDALLFASQAQGAQMLYGDVYLGGQSSDVETHPDVIESGYMLRKMIPHQATFYERATFEAVGGYDESFKIAGDYDLYARLFEVEQISHYHIPHPIAIFDLEGISNGMNFRSLRKQENHQIRKRYFKSYRYSLKYWRQEIRNFFSGVRRRST